MTLEFDLTTTNQGRSFGLSVAVKAPVVKGTAGVTTFLQEYSKDLAFRCSQTQWGIVPVLGLPSKTSTAEDVVAHIETILTQLQNLKDTDYNPSAEYFLVQPWSRILNIPDWPDPFLAPIAEIFENYLQLDRQNSLLKFILDVPEGQKAYSFVTKEKGEALRSSKMETETQISKVKEAFTLVRNTPIDERVKLDLNPDDTRPPIVDWPGPALRWSSSAAVRAQYVYGDGIYAELDIEGGDFQTLVFVTPPGLLTDGTRANWHNNHGNETYKLDSPNGVACHYINGEWKENDRCAMKKTGDGKLHIMARMFPALDETYSRQVFQAHSFTVRLIAPSGELVLERELPVGDD